MRTMVFRLIMFYVLAITVMLMMTPWDRIGEGGGGITGSPFVRAFAAVGIPYAAGVMNLVVISAALSSANTNLYTTTRMLFSLSRSPGMAPAWLATVVRHGVPRRAVVVASVGMLAAICLAIYSPGPGVSRALRHRRRRHAVHLDGDSLHVPALPPGADAANRWPGCRSGCRRTASRQASGSSSLVAIAATTFFVDGLQIHRLRRFCHFFS